jgi:hypothetical protein
VARSRRLSPLEVWTRFPPPSLFERLIVRQLPDRPGIVRVSGGSSRDGKDRARRVQKSSTWPSTHF